MEWIEVTGRTVDEAKERALDELGVHESELEFELLDDARGGFLGRIGRSDARIRARIKPLSREKPADKRRRRRHEGRSEGGESSGGGRRPRPARAPSEPAAAPGGAGRMSERTESSSSAPTTPRSRSRSRSRSRRPSSDRTSQSTNEEQSDMSTEVNLDEQEAVAVEFVQGLLDALGVAGSVQTGRTEDEGISLDIVGGELGLLVGPKGATLAALEELTRAAVQHAAEGQRARLHVDVGGYRQRRREALAEFTRKIAAEVLAAGTARPMEPMSAADRKVVHDTVAELDGLATESEGEDARRHVVIRPI
ncbi:MAG: spoIIIJ-associated protein [Actinomycetota bacterium]|nr:spoIIIJ-associated protein [Actinomycetota bacterium]